MIASEIAVPEKAEIDWKSEQHSRNQIGEPRYRLTLSSGPSANVYLNAFVRGELNVAERRIPV